VSERRELSIALVGAGHMGRLHAEKIDLLRREGVGIRLVGAADIIESRAHEVAGKVDAMASSDYRELLPLADAAIVAVPTSNHRSVVEGVLEAGLDVLVEKPIAANVEEAEALIALAERRQRVMQVGHLEWFNSAMRAVRERIDRPRYVEAHRLGRFPDRGTDVDVVRDLMIHDLDILQQILGEEPVQIDSIGVPVLTSQVDIANARIAFPSGCVANLTASRVSPTPMRRIRFFQRAGTFSIDFLEQSATVVQRASGASQGEPQIAVEKLEVDRGDALRDQLRAFVRAVRTRERPMVDGASGMGALRTAVRVIEAMPTLEELR